MRVWDVHPGYLSRKRLLGQHAEIHGVWSVLMGGGEGYSHHPETKRWRNQLPRLCRVHNLTVAEMLLRGFNHHSPMGKPGEVQKGLIYVDSPLRQFALLREKQRSDDDPRIPMPRTLKGFWTQHEYAVMARGQQQYKSIAAEMDSTAHQALSGAADQVEHILAVLRTDPVPPQLREVLQNLSHEAGICENHVLNIMARGIYMEATQHGNTLLRSHSVLTDALALGMGGEDT